MDISKQQTELLKGIGILLIVLHNYFHWIPPFTGENEFIFNVQYTENLINALGSSIAEIPNTLFSFFGHYGVQLFIFISGYGLAKSYGNNTFPFLKFIKKRMLKLYPAFLIGIAVLLIYKFLVQSYIPTIAYLSKLGLKLTTLHTLVPRQALSINGPWWFYGIIAQLYLVFIPLYILLKKWNWLGFLAVSLLSYALVFITYEPLLAQDIFIMANLPGHLPEFSFGILLALSPNFKWKWYWLVLAVAVLVMGNFYFTLFPITFLSITVVLVWLFLQVKRPGKYGTQFLMFYGKISMFLFAIHAFFRKPYFINFALTSDSAIKKIAIAFLYLLVVTLVAFICQKGYSSIVQVLRATKS